MERVTGHGSPVTAFVALGSNMQDPPVQIRTGARAIAELPHTRLLRVSSLYRNPAVGYRDQPDFVNAVACVETQLSARSLLESLLAIERARGRVRDFPNAPRTLDLDIVLYGEHVIREPGLTIPHPRMRERAFVLIPLAEIAPNAWVPGAGPAAQLAERVETAGMVKLSSAYVT